MAARCGAPSDFVRSAAIILGSNPLGGVCGAVCPDSFCVRACVHRTFDHPVRIQPVQAAIVRRAHAAGMHAFERPTPTGRRIAVLGAGPAGLGAAAVLAQLGHAVTLFDDAPEAGGACMLIPEFRLDRSMLRQDVDTLLSWGDITTRFSTHVDDPASLITSREFHAVVVAAGRSVPNRPAIPGAQAITDWRSFLADRARPALDGMRVAVIGCGAIAVDCAVTARERGAEHVEILYRRRFDHAPLQAYERSLLLDAGVVVIGCTRVDAVRVRQGRVTGVVTQGLTLPAGQAPLAANFIPTPGERPVRRSVDMVIAAIGSTSDQPPVTARGVFPAGDFVNGETTVVEAVASGKNAAMDAHRFVTKERGRRHDAGVKSTVVIAGRPLMPVPLDAEFFGRPIRSPFLLSAAPHTDGYDQVRLAYEAGWSGAVMKTAFHNLPIHIPAEYMVVLGERTFANCDNVSGHPLERVCDEIRRLVTGFPDRLTLGSTGGPVTGDDASDRRVWQLNTRMLEQAGAMGIEYSLSCPQGGDGTHGDIVSQDAELSAKVIGWVLDAGDPAVPKLFKLTGAVTSIRSILLRIRQVFEAHPRALAGVTLANSFPSLTFRPGPEGRDLGVVVGMSGEGVFPISCLTLAKAAGLGLTISGNGGPMNHRMAARFMELGAQTVQFCTIVMKHGLGVVDDLHSGLSHHLHTRGLRSVAALIGAMGTHPITGFDELTAVKRVPQLTADLCGHCGNCTRCPYRAITRDRRGLPVIDPTQCIGCSLCVQKCYAGALAMRARRPGEEERH